VTRMTRPKGEWARELVVLTTCVTSIWQFQVSSTNASDIMLKAGYSPLILFRFILENTLLMACRTNTLSLGAHLCSSLTQCRRTVGGLTTRNRGADASMEDTGRPEELKVEPASIALK
jgi:hypothetical protein